MDIDRNTILVYLELKIIEFSQKYLAIWQFIILY